MTCCICGSYCKKMKQWYNRDNGYSICKGCVRAEKRHGTSDAELHELYGEACIHYEAAK